MTKPLNAPPRHCPCGASIGTKSVHCRPCSYARQTAALIERNRERSRAATHPCADCSALLRKASSVRCRTCAGRRRMEWAAAPTKLSHRENVAAVSSEALGCEALLRAHLRTGQHWITDRERFAAACASVGLAA